MALEADKKDRSYQYGRLLAVLEKIERDTYDREENRETNAIRLQSVFVRRPAYATKIIIEQLKNGYYPKLKSSNRVYYDKLIGQIMEVISDFGEKDYNKALAESYLLGYYLQKNALYTRKEKEQEDNENE
jgi:CRISPR-associated protein Csd1